MVAGLIEMSRRGVGTFPAVHQKLGRVNYTSASIGSLQGRLWELDETLWKLAKRLPDYAPQRKRRIKTMPIQLSLLEDLQATQE